MAIIQAIITFIGRTVGKILSALLDWAVIALFGRVSGQRKTLLWALMAAAAAWPLLLLGVAAPRAAVFLMAFVPMSASLAPGLVRTIWIALAVLVPLAVGVTLRLLSPTGRREGWLLSIVRGVPITAGLSAAFTVLLVTVPVLRVVSVARGRQDTYVPLVTTPDSYPLAAAIVPETLQRHGIAIARTEPPWWSALPSQILTRLGQGAFAGYVPEQSAYFRNGDLEAALYPNALLLRGPARVTARAHVLTAEALTGYPDMFQTVSPAAQELERQIQRVWEVVRLNPEAHARAAPLLSRLDEITRDLAKEPLPFEDLQVIHRQLLQLGRALAGEPPLLDQTLPNDAKEKVMTLPTPHSELDYEARSLTTRELVARALKMGSLLVSKEVELARAEIRADIAAELGMVKLLLAGAAAGFFGVNLLFVAVVFALTAWLPGWLAALAVAVLLLAIGAVLGLIGWRRRVSTPLAVTRKTVKEDMQWAKERLA